MENLKRIFSESIEVKAKLMNDAKILETILKVSDEIVNCFAKDGKVLLCGNGGSAADAQHLAAEFSGRFYYDRPPLFAEALHVNTSYLTAVGNDYSYDEIYARLIQAKGRKGDVLIGLSTSGNSKNVIRAFEQARKQGMIVVAMTGETGGKMKECCDYLINVPSIDTPRIQEAHITIGHAICEFVESRVFPKQK